MSAIPGNYTFNATNQNGYNSCPTTYDSTYSPDIPVFGQQNFGNYNALPATTTTNYSFSGAADTVNPFAMLKTDFNIFDVAADESKKDNTICEKDLETVMNRSTTSADKKAQIKFILENKALQFVDKNGDNKVTKDELDEYMQDQANSNQKPTAAQAKDAAEKIMNYMKSQLLFGYQLDKSSLESLANSELPKTFNSPVSSKVSKEISAAAKLLLNNKDILDQLDTAEKGGDADGVYSQSDFEAFSKKDITVTTNATAPATPQAPVIIPPAGYPPV